MSLVLGRTLGSQGIGVHDPHLSGFKPSPPFLCWKEGRGEALAHPFSQLQFLEWSPHLLGGVKKLTLVVRKLALVLGYGACSVNARSARTVSLRLYVGVCLSGPCRRSCREPGALRGVAPWRMSVVLGQVKENVRSGPLEASPECDLLGRLQQGWEETLEPV